MKHAPSYLFPSTDSRNLLLLLLVLHLVRTLNAQPRLGLRLRTGTTNHEAPGLQSLRTWSHSGKSLGLSALY